MIGFCAAEIKIKTFIIYMKIKESKLKGCYMLEPSIFKDERGYFFESFNEKKFNKEIGYKVKFIQDNQSFSTYGVLRGLHFQSADDAQAKLMRVLSGKILDIAVDIRKDSPTFGNYITVELSSENKKQLFIPKGFAHGFVVLSKTAEFLYKVDNYYAPKSESGILYNDPDLDINWKIDKDNIIINNKDLDLSLLKDLEF